MSDTPRTDTEFGHFPLEGPIVGARLIRAREFTRGLELELKSAHAEIESLYKQAHELVSFTDSNEMSMLDEVSCALSMLAHDLASKKLELAACEHNRVQGNTQLQAEIERLDKLSQSQADALAKEIIAHVTCLEELKTLRAQKL